ncbi:MAG: hypothetical protein V3V96_10150 [Acidiferrobacterales bacterium]
MTYGIEIAEMVAIDRALMQEEGFDPQLISAALMSAAQWSLHRTFASWARTTRNYGERRTGEQR